MKSTVKRFIPLIIVLTFGLLLFACVIGLELNLKSINKLDMTGSRNIYGILSDACFVPSVFILGAAVLGFIKYLNIGAILYSVGQSIWQLLTLGFIPKGCRKAYREYRKAAREEKGTGLAILFSVGLVFLALAFIFMYIN